MAVVNIAGIERTREGKDDGQDDVPKLVLSYHTVNCTSSEYDNGGRH